MQHSPRRRQVIDGGDPDPPEHLVERVGVGEDVVRRLPVGVLVGVAEARHPERRPVSERSAKISGSGAGSDRRLDRFGDPDRIVAKQLPSKRRMIRPAMRAVACREQRRQLASHFVAKRDKIERLSPFGQFLGAPGRRHLADDGRQQSGSMPPANQVQAFERLVDEVERVSAVGEGAFGLGGEQRVGEHSGRETLSIAVSRVRSAASR